MNVHSYQYNLNKRNMLKQINLLIKVGIIQCKQIYLNGNHMIKQKFKQ